MRTQLFASLLVAVDAHGRLLVPRPRLPLWSAPGMAGHTEVSASWREDEPPFLLSGPTTFNGHEYTSAAFRCHDFAAAEPAVVLVAGTALELRWTLPANHPGDCSLYISYDEA